MRIKVMKRRDTPLHLRILLSVASVGLALLVGALLVALTGNDPVRVYQVILRGAFGSRYGISETLVKASPIMLCALGIAISFRMKLWNIGAEGQLAMGAFGATFLPLYLPELPRAVMLPGMIALGFLFGGLWALLPAILRALRGVNEVITTLMLNYVAGLWLAYLCFGPWRDPDALHAFSPRFPLAARLPTLLGTRVHSGLLMAIVAAVVLWVMLEKTRWGYEVYTIGASPRVARYAGMDVPKHIVLAMFLSGGLAGLAGMAEVAGTIHRLQPHISPGYGYTGIIVAWLAVLHPGMILVVSILFSSLLTGGYSVQMIGVPSEVTYMLQGVILFFILAGEFLVKYRFVRLDPSGASPPGDDGGEGGT